MAYNLGFKTLVNKGNWYSDDIEPGEIKNSIGDWHPSMEKFSEFKKQVEQIHKLKMNYLLWIAPNLVGKESESAEIHQELLQEQTNLKLSSLSPGRRKRKRSSFQTLRNF